MLIKKCETSYISILDTNMLILYDISRTLLPRRPSNPKVLCNFKPPTSSNLPLQSDDTIIRRPAGVTDSLVGVNNSGSRLSQVTNYASFIHLCETF